MMAAVTVATFHPSPAKWPATTASTTGTAINMIGTIAAMEKIIPAAIESTIFSST